MNKVNKWKRKMNTYYSDLHSHKLLSDLEASGFKIGVSAGDNSQAYTRYTAKSEIAAGLETKETIISEDGSLAVILK